MMKKTTLSRPTLAAIAVTRGLLGFGAGLLAARRLPRARRRRLGWALVGIGAVSTVPLALAALRGR